MLTRWVCTPYSSCSNSALYLHRSQSFPRDCVAGMFFHSVLHLFQLQLCPACCYAQCTHAHILWLCCSTVKWSYMSFTPQARQYTDISRFTLRCLVCSVSLTGHEDAQNHARATGHTNFGEVWPSNRQNMLYDRINQLYTHKYIVTNCTMHYVLYK